MQTKLKLSEIIKTDCYIDCGTNKKLREVYPLIDIPEMPTNIRMFDDEKSVFILGKYLGAKGTVSSSFSLSHPYPIHNISEIDLNN